jgi:transcriptional regulator with XRE-family HTH domain
MRKSQENNEPYIFNLNLKYLREQRNLPALKMAKVLNIAWSTYMAYESVTWPRPETLIAISDYFNISVDDLIKKDLKIAKDEQCSDQQKELPADSLKKRIEDLENLIETKNELIQSLKESSQSQKETIQLQKEIINELKNSTERRGAATFSEHIPEHQEKPAKART